MAGCSARWFRGQNLPLKFARRFWELGYSPDCRKEPVANGVSTPERTQIQLEGPSMRSIHHRTIQESLKIVSLVFFLGGALLIQPGCARHRGSACAGGSCQTSNCQGGSCQLGADSYSASPSYSTTPDQQPVQSYSEPLHTAPPSSGSGGSGTRNGF